MSLSQPCLPSQTAIAVGTSYDALAELFECVANFIGRLRIYSEIPFEPTISDLIIRIMVEMLSVLALATKQIRQGRLSTPLISQILLYLSSLNSLQRNLQRSYWERARLKQCYKE